MSAGRRRLAGPLVATIAVGLVVGTGAGFGARFLTGAPQPINGGAAAAEVQDVLAEDYGLADATDTTCPTVEREPGATFTCTTTSSALGSGGTLTVTVTILNEAGQLSVGAPQ